MVAVAWKNPNIYIDFASYLPKYIGMKGTGWEPFIHYGNSVLQDRILFASTWLFMGMSIKELADEVFTNDIKSWEDKSGQIKKDEIILLQYGWDNRWITKDDKLNKPKKYEYLNNFPGLSEEAATYLAKKKIKLIGTDTPTVDSISAFLDAQNLGTTEPSHIKLLKEHNIPILEGLKNLHKLPSNGAYLFTLPLNIKHGSGSPVRAVAFIPKKKK